MKDIVSHPDQVTRNVKLVTANFKKILEKGLGAVVVSDDGLAF